MRIYSWQTWVGQFVTQCFDFCRGDVTSAGVCVAFCEIGRRIRGTVRGSGGRFIRKGTAVLTPAFVFALASLLRAIKPGPWQIVALVIVIVAHLVMTE